MGRICIQLFFEQFFLPQRERWLVCLLQHVAHHVSWRGGQQQLLGRDTPRHFASG